MALFSRTAGEPVVRPVPPIDAQVPAQLKTATFASG